MNETLKNFVSFYSKQKKFPAHIGRCIFRIIKFLKELVFKNHQRIIPSQLAVIKIASGQEINQMEFSFICFSSLFASHSLFPSKRNSYLEILHTFRLVISQPTFTLSTTSKKANEQLGFALFSFCVFLFYIYIL